MLHVQAIFLLEYTSNCLHKRPLNKTSSKQELQIATYKVTKRYDSSVTSILARPLASFEKSKSLTIGQIHSNDTAIAESPIIVGHFNCLMELIRKCCSIESPQHKHVLKKRKALQAERIQ